MSDEDYLMALQLQREFDRELEISEDETNEVKSDSKAKWKHREKNNDLDCTQNLVHPEWETLDPTPDVYALFGAFDDKFFQGRLKCVTLEWSKRMYSCAGICYSHRTRLGMAIIIRLSEPLLKLRSRKDLVETLLHEMIHAYCSVLGIREGNGGHGPNFKKIMHGINKVAGTNITVYHTFHDEVDIYKTHWWRCNGICQNRKPFFGYVKRTSNRAPGPNDIWWKQHLESCGGTFLKIREPEKRPSKAKKENNPKSVAPSKDIRTFFGNENKNKVPGSSGVKSNGGGTVVIRGNVKTSDNAWKPPSAKGFQAGVNKVIGFKDLNGSPGSTITKPKASIDLSGTGYCLGSTSPKVSTTSGTKPDLNHVRNIWAAKFPTTACKRPSEEVISIESPEEAPSNEKRRKLEKVETVEVDEKWTEVDDDVMLKEDKQTVIEIDSDEDDIVLGAESGIQAISTPVKQTSEERQRQIKQEILDSSDCLLSEDDIELIDDDYNDNIVTTNAELADTSLIDDLFGEDTLLKDFNRQNAMVASNSRYHSDSNKDIICCPVCQDQVTRQDFSDHLDGCVGISVKIVPRNSARNVVPSSKRKDKPPAKKLTPKSIKRALKNVGYEDEEVDEVVGPSTSSSSATDESFNRRRGLDTSTHACPVCGREVDVDRINEHLDVCLPDN